MSDNEIVIFDPTESRTVKPKRTPKPCTLPIVAIGATQDAQGNPQTTAMSEQGTVLTFDEYAATLYEQPRTMVITYSPETCLALLNERWCEHPRWTWRVSQTQRNGKPLLVKRVAYWGFRDKSKRSNKLHVVLDANSFLRSQDPHPEQLLQLGIEIREFCNAWQLEIRPSGAGLASQLLRHPMFYPFPRRKVPSFIDDAVRPHLPGGYFELYADAGQRIESSTYVDQQSAHHYAAMSTPLPNANSVRAQGYSRTDTRAWARKGGHLYERAMQNHGLVRALVTVPPLTSTRHNGIRYVKGQNAYVPRIMQRPGQRVAHLWTNEIPYLEKLGLEIHHLICVWGTSEVDNGLAKYAQWAQEQSRTHPHLKAMLLMPYGLLAKHESDMTIHHPGGAEPLILANKFLSDTFARTFTSKPQTRNALQLGLIQAFVRSLSLDMANQLDNNGHEVISIYADAIFVRLTEGKQMPIFAPWRIKEEVPALEINQASRIPVRGKLKRDYSAVH